MISDRIREKAELYNGLLGCIKHNATHSFYLMPIAWWVLDYKSYDPIGSSESNPAFRNNIYVVDTTNVELFLESIEDDRLELSDVEALVSEYRGQLDNYSQLMFSIDFDERVYITSFLDIEVEKYLPKGWHGKSDDPLKYLPNDIARLWANSR